MVTALAAVAAGSLPGASASGDATVTVRGADLADLARTRLNVVGCADVFSRSGQAPRTAIGVVPVAPADRRTPDDKRSLALTAAPGDAVGPISYAPSLASTAPPAIFVYGEQPMSGVGYVGYQAPGDVGSSRMWIGRTDLPVPGGAWTDVTLAGAAFTWIQYDMGTRQQVAGPVAATPVAAFTASQGGDGYGFYALGFGCEGREFNTDGWRLPVAGGTTTYEFEGYSATVAGGGDATIAPGGSATLSAQLVSDGAAPRLVLEAKDADGDWGAAADQPQPGSTSVSVSPRDTTTYRWKIYSTPMVEAVQGRDQSAPFTITVDAPADEPVKPEATRKPDRQPDPAKDAPAPATTAPTQAASEAPAAPAPATPEPPAPTPTPEAPAPTPTTATTPAEPSPTPEPSATETPAG